MNSGRLGHFGDLGEPVDLLDLRNGDAVLFPAQQERDQLHFAQFLAPAAVLWAFPRLLRFDSL